MQSSIDRHFRESYYEYSVLSSRFFKGSRDILWECGQLGDKTPKSIIPTLWWKLTQHFGLRGRQEHHSTRVEDSSFQKDETGAPYIVCAKGVTKIRQNGLH